MATGFDVAAGAVGFASLGVLLLQGCVKGFVLLSTAQHFGQDADLVRNEIEFEQYRLFKWAEKVGLENGSPTRNMDWQIVHGHLKGLEALLSDTAKFKSEYRLELITTEENLSPNDLAKPKKGFRRFFKPEFHNETARTLQKEISIWKRLKWAAIDKEGIDLLMNDIRRFVDDLWNMLQYDDLEYIRSGIEALARHAISQTQGSTELSNLEKLLGPNRQSASRFEDSAVQSALTLKQQSLVLGYCENDRVMSSASFTTKPLSKTLSGATLVGSSPGTHSSRNSISNRSKNPRGPLSFRLLKLDPEMGCDSKSREMGLYGDKPVLVEWKFVERGDESKLKHRIKTLATLLQEIDSASFHSLKCLGYLKDPKSENYGYIFQMPTKTSNFMSLDNILSDHMIAPGLDDRLALGIALTETILQLHTSGWLHKGVRSENVIFFQKNSILDIKDVYLEGYEYARADNPSDMTETPMPQQEANLSRHPALLKANRASFRKAFDLYGLGCILIEIALWENLTTILLHFLRKEIDPTMPARIPPASLTYATKDEMVRINKSKARLLARTAPDSIGNAVEFAVGRTFASVVQSCLAAGDEKASAGDLSDDEDTDSDDACIDLELEILEKLRKCKS